MSNAGYREVMSQQIPPLITIRTLHRPTTLPVTVRHVSRSNRQWLRCNTGLFCPGMFSGQFGQVLVAVSEQNGYQTIPFGVHIHNLTFVFIFE